MKQFCAILEEWIHVIFHLFKPIEWTPRVNPNGNYWLCLLMVCQCKFLDANKGITLRGVFMEEEAVPVCAHKGIYGKSPFFAHKFCFFSKNEDFKKCKLHRFLR